jgi:uncharacterized membrane protein YeaQ/YmgE (transglycosylase-associated protein family)
VTIEPGLVLGILVGVFHAAVSVALRSPGGRLPLLVLAAIIGALAGDILGDRLGIDVLSIGDFRLVAASIGAWVGIGLSSVVAVLGPTRKET